RRLQRDRASLPERGSLIVTVIQLGSEPARTSQSDQSGKTSCRSRARDQLKLWRRGYQQSAVVICRGRFVRLAQHRELWLNHFVLMYCLERPDRTCLTMTANSHSHPVRMRRCRSTDGAANTARTSALRCTRRTRRDGSPLPGKAAPAYRHTNVISG